MMSESVIAVILQQNRLLLIKRRDVPAWVLPGGGVDSGETPEIAVLREVKEETGLEAVIKRKVAVYTPLNRLAKLTTVFECTPIGGELSIGEETADVKYFSLDGLPEPFFHIHEEWLQDALQNKDEVIERPLTSVTYFKVLQYACRHPIRVLRLLLSRLGVPLNS